MVLIQEIMQAWDDENTPTDAQEKELLEGLEGTSAGDAIQTIMEISEQVEENGSLSQTQKNSFDVQLKEKLSSIEWSIEKGPRP